MKKILYLTLLLTFAICQPSTAQTADEALRFLYQYMPLPDSTDYSREFWQMNVDYALRARQEMPWGSRVPEREWKHFVLPLRVNNENLDEARKEIYETLKGRVQGLSMYDAILEINHWCHEKVTYQPSDGRTSAPLATMKNAIGRCGEESTFGVTALRAMGIPARQVYTPRWAHTDDNHAWVEAWADGKWYFLGACEPEPVLNLGWFNAPASRGMLMHTKVFGHYDGPENILGQNACYTEIDVTDHYAPTETFNVQTVDAQGKAVVAKVEFKLYNYAEFYTLATKQTDAQGRTNFHAGLGDLLVWASTSDGHWGYAKHSPGTKTLTITLDKTTHHQGKEDLDITPPKERNTVPEFTEEQGKRNKQRLAYEDSIRNAYVSQMPKKAGGDSLIISGRGNVANLNAFFTGIGNEELGRQLVSIISAKDRRDVSVDVLQDHYMFTQSANPYVLNPRVSNEMLTPYRAILQREITVKTIDEWAQWVRDNIQIDEESNPQHLCMFPVSVWRHRITDSHSRDIFFVAGARSKGIPARIDEVTGKTQYADAQGLWHDVNLSPEVKQGESRKGTLKLTCQSNPEYYTHFTISRIENGSPVLLNYPEEGTTWQSTFAKGELLDEGDYLLVTGTRLASGGVLAHMEFFHIDADKTTQVELLQRHDDQQVQVIGSFNSENIYTALDGKKQSILSTTGRGYYVLGLLRDHHEPSNHARHDISIKQKELDAIGRPILMLNAEDNPQLCTEIRNSLHLTSNELPLFIIADTFNRVVWYSQGYTIGMGEQLLKVLKAIQ